MSSLSSLPHECILRILSCLYLPQIERLALTFNKCLLSICLPLLQPLFRARRDEKYLIDLFNGHAGFWWGDGVIDEDLFKRHGLDVYSAPLLPSQHLEYLNLKGDLQWLAEFAKLHWMEADVGPEWVTHRPGHKGYADLMDNLIRSATRLGLRIPTALEQLVRNPALRGAIPSATNSEFDLGPLCGKLCKVRTSAVAAWSKGRWDPELSEWIEYEETRTDVDEYGYVFQLYGDSQDGRYSILYLDTQAREAVLVADAGIDEGDCDDPDSLEYGNKDPVQLTELEKELGVRPMSSPKLVELEAIGFENWLVNLYFAERVWQIENNVVFKDYQGYREERELPDFVREYLTNVYTERGRNMQ